MMRARNASAFDSHRHLGSSRSDSPSSCGDVTPNNEQRITPPTGTDAVKGTEEEANLWKYVIPCGSQEAMKAIDIRTALASKLGKAEATRILAQCIATVAKSADGQKNRVLKAPTGELPKLK